MRCKRYFHFEAVHACDEQTDGHRARAATHSTKASDLSLCLLCVRHSSTSFTRRRHVLLAISVIMPGSCPSWPASLAIYILCSQFSSVQFSSGPIALSKFKLRINRTRSIGLTPRITRTVYRYFWTYPFLLFSLPVSPLLVFLLYINRTRVGFYRMSE